MYVPAAFSLVNGVSAGMSACADTELGEFYANCGMVDHSFPSLKKTLAWKFQFLILDLLFLPHREGI